MLTPAVQAAEPTLYCFGSFNPMHLGHVAMAQAALAQGAFGRVLFVPAGSPPHKSALLPAAVRWAGVQATLAWAADARLQASPVELDAAAVASEPTYYTYTSHTLRRLLGLPLSAPLPMGLPVLMGQDCFETLATWHEAAHLLERLQCWVYPRGEEDGQAQREAPPSQPWYQTPAVAALVAQGAQLHPLQGPALPVSATLLRAALQSQPTAAQQALLQQWLAPAVLQALVAL